MANTKKTILVLLGATLLASCIFLPSDVSAFAVIDSTDSRFLARLDSSPQQYSRYRPNVQITYRIDEDFSLVYDSFSEYLVREALSEWSVAAGPGQTSSLNGLWPQTYYRAGTVPNSGVDLTSVLTHEVGHALGLQHPDASFYNLDAVTLQPLSQNYIFLDVLGSRVLSQRQPFGGEMMAEGFNPNPGTPTTNFGIGAAYHRVPSIDEVQSMEFLYPDELDLEEVSPDSDANIVVTAYSTPGGSAAGNGGVSTFEFVDPADPSKGTFINSSVAEVNAGIPVLYKQLRQSFTFINAGTENVGEIELVTDGSATWQPIDASSSGVFRFQNLVRRERQNSNRELGEFVWSMPRGGALPPGGRVDFILELDVNDWVVVDAFGRQSDGDVFDVPLVEIEALPPADFAQPPLPTGGIPSGVLASGPPDLPGEQPDPSQVGTDLDAPSEGFVAIRSLSAGTRVETVEIVELSAWDFVNGTDLDSDRFDALLTDRSSRPRIVEIGEEVSTSRPLTVSLPAAVDGQAEADRFLGIRVTSSNENGIGQQIVVVGQPQGVGNFDVRCDAFGVVETCCPDPQLATVLSETRDVFSLNEEQCVVAGAGKDEVVALSSSSAGVQRVSLGANKDYFESAEGR